MAEEVYSTKRKRRLIHPGSDPNGVSAIYLDENQIVLTDALNESSITVNKSAGIGIQGPISVQTTPDQIRFAALWKINPLVTTSLPSSIYTPIPWLRQSIPQPPKELVQGIVTMASLLSTLR